MIKPKIFIGSSTEKLDIAYAIQENLQSDAEATVWTQAVFDLGSDFLDEILKKLNQTDFGVFVFLPDDRVTIRTRDYTAVRDNVLFEYGLFVGRLGRTRCVYVLPKDAQNIWIPTDLAGVVSAKYDPDSDNLVAALGPACAAIRRKIKELGIRESRFRILPQEEARSNRIGAVSETGKEQLNSGKEKRDFVARLLLPLTSRLQWKVWSGMVLLRFRTSQNFS